MGKGGVVFDVGEVFFLGGCDDDVVFEEDGGGVVVVGVEVEEVYFENLKKRKG